MAPLSVNIRPYRPGDEAAIGSLIVGIQAAEFGFDITLEDQPDLSAIAEFYLSGSGGFWVAEDEARMVGTIALKDIGDGQGALRKMFVDASYRGSQRAVAAELLHTLLASARDSGLTRIILGTTEAFRAAHRFYEKHGFARVPESALPATFPRIGGDTRFYGLDL